MSAKPIKTIGILSMLAGLIMLVAGAITWATVTSELKDERITVAQDADMLAGKKVAGPFTAFAEAQIIKKHALHNEDARLADKTYAELGAISRQAEKDGDTALAEAATKARTSSMNGSFLRASLFTSVVSYGVSAFVMGMGLMMGLIGWALTKIAKLLGSDRRFGVHDGHLVTTSDDEAIEAARAGASAARKA